MQGQSPNSSSFSSIQSSSIVHPKPSSAGLQAAALRTLSTKQPSFSVFDHKSHQKTVKTLEIISKIQFKEEHSLCWQLQTSVTTKGTGEEDTTSGSTIENTENQVQIAKYNYSGKIILSKSESWLSVFNKKELRQVESKCTTQTNVLFCSKSTSTYITIFEPYNNPSEKQATCLFHNHRSWGVERLSYSREQS